MADTSVPLSGPQRDALAEYRHPDHETWDDVVDSITTVLPSPEELADGCDQCGDPPHRDGPIDEVGGVIVWYPMAPEYGGGVDTWWFCTNDCAKAFFQTIRDNLPREPDLIRVGGADAPPVELTDELSYYIDGEREEVTIGLPGVFARGENPDHTYDYHGEPVYIQHKGKWVQEGVIDEVIHEETTTGLLLRSDHDVTGPNHPDLTKREEYEELADAYKEVGERGEVPEES